MVTILCYMIGKSTRGREKKEISMMTQSRNGLLDNTDDLIWNLTPPELFKEKEEKIEIKKQYQQ